MGLSEAELEEFAARLFEAYDTKSPIAPLTEDADFSTEEAYEIQSRVFDELCADRDRLVGHKLGLVSEAKQEQLGIPEPIFCGVAPETLFPEAVVEVDAMISPRIEAEIGLVLGEDVPAPVTTTDVLTATDAVVPVVEILESRFQGWGIPTAQDVIADLTSAGGVVVGETLRDVRDVDLAMEGVAVSVNGEVEATGLGADIMGHPARAVSWLGNRLVDVDDGLQAGELVMTGGITAAIDMAPGDVYDVQFTNIGSITVRAE